MRLEVIKEKRFARKTKRSNTHIVEVIVKAKWVSRKEK